MGQLAEKWDPNLLYAVLSVFAAATLLNFISESCCAYYGYQAFKQLIPDDGDDTGYAPLDANFRTADLGAQRGSRIAPQQGPPPPFLGGMGNPAVNRPITQIQGFQPFSGQG